MNAFVEGAPEIVHQFGSNPNAEEACVGAAVNAFASERPRAVVPQPEPVSEPQLDAKEASEERVAVRSMTSAPWDYES